MEFLPSGKLTGCSDNKGTAYFSCLKEFVKKYEGIENAKAEFRTVSEERQGSHVYRITEVCFTDKFCRRFKEKIYSPSMFGIIKEYAIIFGLGMIVGFGAGK